MAGIPLLAMKYELVGLLILAVLAGVPFVLTLKLLFGLLRWRVMKKPVSRRLIYVALAADLVVAACVVDAWFIEPHMLTVTHLSATSPKIASSTGDLKIVHISDIHFEQHSEFTRRILSTITTQKPDLIVVSGDNPQMRYSDRDQFFEFLTSLRKIAPVYACPGYYEDEMDMLSSPIGGNYLSHGESVTLRIRGTRVTIQGFAPLEDPRTTPVPAHSDALYLVLDHTPDSIESVSRLGADWCFVGHTHGGQFRLPIWGAVTTLCRTGKRFEYGHYRVGKTEFFVSRGLGLEPRPAPQVRFLCPPEVVVLTLTKSGTSPGH